MELASQKHRSVGQCSASASPAWSRPLAFKGISLPARHSQRRSCSLCVCPFVHARLHRAPCHSHSLAPSRMRPPTNFSYPRAPAWKNSTLRFARGGVRWLKALATERRATSGSSSGSACQSRRSFRSCNGCVVFASLSTCVCLRGCVCWVVCTPQEARQYYRMRLLL